MCLGKSLHTCSLATLLLQHQLFPTARRVESSRYHRAWHLRTVNGLSRTRQAQTCALLVCWRQQGRLFSFIA